MNTNNLSNQDTTLTSGRFANNFIIPASELKRFTFQWTINTGQFALWEFDVIESRTSYSTEFIDMLGYTKSEFNSFSHSCFINHAIHPDDVAQAIVFLSKIKNNELEEFQFISRMKHRNGEYLWLYYTGCASELNGEGQPLMYSGMIRVVSAKEAVELQQKNYQKDLQLLHQKNQRREKEQHLLCDILNTFNNARSIPKILKSTADQIAAFYNEYTACGIQIFFNDKEYLSQEFISTEHHLYFSFESFSEKKLELRLFHEHQLFKKAPSLLAEARSFLTALSCFLKNCINKKETELEFQNMFIELEAKVEKGTEELKIVNQKLTEHNKDMNDSINYANSIQRAILPESDLINTIFDEAFVFYKPRDIVSGDFYWCHEEAEKVFYVCADCTGHGVPGALMSMVGNQLLNHLIRDQKMSDPTLILKEMNQSILNLFSKNSVNGQMRDGMSISLCVIDRVKKTISFSGADNSAYIFRGNGIILLPADKNSIGGYSLQDGFDFTKTEMAYETGDLLYMFTDGFPDQFGGPKGKKLMKRKLLDYLSSIKDINMTEQKQLIGKMLTEWKGINFQVDDITMLGAKL